MSKKEEKLLKPNSFLARTFNMLKPSISALHVGRLTLKLFLLLFVSIGGGIAAMIIFVRSGYEQQLTTIRIPILIPEANPQGGQFALGVQRAAMIAEMQFRDTIGQSKVRPYFFNEDVYKNKKEFDVLIEKLRQLKAPIVIGPLQSSSAFEFIPVIAGEDGLKIPMILGIPTNPKLLNASTNRVWRLSPNDDAQMDSILSVYENLSKSNSELDAPILVFDSSKENEVYVNHFRENLLKRIVESNLKRPKDIIELSYKTLNKLEFAFKESTNGMVVYAGMKDMGLQVLKTAQKAGFSGTILMTDGCITDYAIMETAGEIFSNVNVLFLFQAPPPTQEWPVLFNYVSYIWNLGMRVSGVIDIKVCAPEYAALSYEVFGYDSYMVALDLLERAHESGEVSADFVYNEMKESPIAKKLVLMGPYEFDVVGGNTNLNFHLYEVTVDGCPIHSDRCPNDPPKGRE